MEKDPIVIVAAKRTPLGNLLGYFKSLNASALGACAIQAAMAQAKIPPEHITEVLMGCVLSAGQGQAPARQAMLKAGLPEQISATTVNKMCGSGMKTIMLGYDHLLANPEDIVIAGGMESMTNAPYLLPKARSGYRLGHETVFDHLFLDGLEDAYEKKLMGVYAENTAQHFHFSREIQDEFAINSLKKAQEATQKGYFKAEIVPVAVTEKQETQQIEQDEAPLTARLEKIPVLKPAFAKDGTVTAANSSSISDGAAAVILMRQSKALAQGYQPLARIIGHSSHAQNPAWFTTAPVAAIEKLQGKLGFSNNDIDLYEINEAFAVVTLAAMKNLNLPKEKVNIHGGACALGHPIGASGTRIVVSLLYALKQYGLKRGIASLCIGGGEATALAIELET